MVGDGHAFDFQVGPRLGGRRVALVEIVRSPGLEPGYSIYGYLIIIYMYIHATYLSRIISRGVASRY